MSDINSPDYTPTELTAETNGAHPFNEGENREEAEGHDATPLVPMDEPSGVVERVIYSDIGVNTLLNRLKQSIASARDFAVFLKKRSGLEEEHAGGLKKLCRTTHETIRRPDNRQGSYAQQFEEVTRIHERMAENGIQFALQLHQMHEDLQEMAANLERGRKQWKQTGLNAEKRVQDSELWMEKAKAKYDTLAEDYDRARTGDKQSGKIFGLKGPKSAAQHEEDLYRKVQAADSDYASRVQTTHSQRRELLSTQRPQAVKALQDLISECDSGLTLQLQKFATTSERLLLNNGISVSPLRTEMNGQGPAPHSLRDVAYAIDNDRDLKNYITSFLSKVPSKSVEIKYERHPTLAPSQQTTPSTNRHSQPLPSSQTLTSFPVNVPPQSSTSNTQYMTPGPPPGAQQTAERGPGLMLPQQQYASAAPRGPPQLAMQQFSSMTPSQPTPPPVSTPLTSTDLPPLKPVFGVSLEELFTRDGSAVPMIVYQCLQAVDLFGLEVEGIYRQSGTASHVAKIKAMFDNDSSQVDFRIPENFFHDVNSVAGLLKQFFRDLPDPLLTSEHYAELIDSARIDDDIVRRDTLHAIINNLPDPNYATLRALTLHLNRVQEHSQGNRMNAGNLAICFGPTLMGFNTGPVADAGWQIRVISTILQNTYQIFDDD
ncbi:MAG: hypothetical protein M1827_007358 [Pycnora praestabilis]|nr:MAG: hypothetical protein M1827_007358 [Pycnora praestabilis]